MAMKPIKLLAPMGLGFKKSLDFKWQYRVTYEVHIFGRWEKEVVEFKNRDAAMKFRRERVGKNKPFYRNFKIEKRLVETTWRPYR